MTEESFEQSALWVKLPWTEDACTMARLMVRRAIASGEGGIMLIVGPSGTGKSVLTNQCRESVTEMLGAAPFVRSCLDIQAVPSGHARDLSRAIASAFRDPVGRDVLATGTGKDFSHFLMTAAPDAGLRLVTCHESHNFRLSGDDDVSTNLAAHVKNLTNVGVSFIFNGLPVLEKRLREHGEVDSRALAKTVRLRVMRKTAEDAAIVAKLLADVAPKLPATFVPSLDSAEVVLSLLHVSGGTLRKLFTLIQNALDLVLEQKRTIVGLDDFRRATCLTYGDEMAKESFTGAFLKYQSDSGGRSD